MKKILIISILCFGFLSGCLKNNEKPHDDNIGQIQNLTESSKEMPNFIIFIKGLVDEYVTNEDISDIKMYDFNVNLKRNGSNVSTESWTGVKLNDVLAKKNITEFYELDFLGSGYVGGEKVNIRYSKDEITDDVYLVFYHNGELISDSQYTSVMLFAPFLEEERWVPSLFRFDVM